MGTIINFFKWLWALLSKALQWFLELPSQITLFVTTFLGVLSSSVSLIVASLPTCASFFDDAASRVSDVGSFIQRHQTGNLFAYVTSIDVAAQYTVSVCGIFLGLVGLLFVTLVSYMITMWVVPMALLVAQKTISLITAGFVKT